MEGAPLLHQEPCRLSWASPAVEPPKVMCVPWPEHQTESPEHRTAHHSEGAFSGVCCMTVQMTEATRPVRTVSYQLTDHLYAPLTLIQRRT